MKTTTSVAFLSLVLCCVSPACADTFGSGANTFDIEFVTIGNPGNAADTTGNPNPAGSVGYAYRMGKYEISEDMIAKANTLGGMALRKEDRGINKPATGVSWNEAARFVNWLNTSEGYTPAYKFALQPGDGGYSPIAIIRLWQAGDVGFDAANPFRNSQAHYFLPSVDEWYKAAYYDPFLDVYYDYPTGSDSAPTAVSSGTTMNTAVFGQSFATGPADITQAGGLSPYGTMGQGGNVDEMEETETDLSNNLGESPRGGRGGRWGFSSRILLSSSRGSLGVTGGSTDLGFRVASVPDPTQVELVPRGSPWSYLDDGTNQGTAWRDPDFDDSAWDSGPAQLGYGDGDEVTVVNCGLSSPQCNSGNFATTYFRQTFEVEDADLVESLTALLLRDDVAAVYLNGIEIFRDDNLSASAAYNTFATSTGEENGTITFAIEPVLLVDGENVLAVEVHQASANSSDISFDFRLTATVVPIPEPSGLILALLGTAGMAAGYRRRRRAV